MNIETKYSLGDIILYATGRKLLKRVNCPCCNGIGSITGYDGKEYECGECEGKGYLEELSDKPEMRVDTIRSVRVECSNFNKIDISYSNRTYYSIYDHAIDEKDVIMSYPADTIEVGYEGMVWKLKEDPFGTKRWVAKTAD